MGTKRTQLLRVDYRHPMDPPRIGTLQITPFVDLSDGRNGRRFGRPIELGQVANSGRLKVIAPHHEGTHVDLPDHVFPDDRPLQWFANKYYFESNAALLIYAPGAEQVCLDNLPWSNGFVYDWIYATNLIIITEHGLKRGRDYFKNIPALPDLEDVLNYLPNCKVVAVDAPAHESEIAFFSPQDAGGTFSGRTLPNTRALLEQKILPLSNLTYSNPCTSKDISGRRPASKQRRWCAGRYAQANVIRSLRKSGPGVYWADLEISPFSVDRTATDGARVRTGLSVFRKLAGFPQASDYTIADRAAENFAAAMA